MAKKFTPLKRIQKAYNGASIYNTNVISYLPVFGTMNLITPQKDSIGEPMPLIPISMLDQYSQGYNGGSSGTPEIESGTNPGVVSSDESSPITSRGTSVRSDAPPTVTVDKEDETIPYQSPLKPPTTSVSSSENSNSKSAVNGLLTDRDWTILSKDIDEGISQSEKIQATMHYLQDKCGFSKASAAGFAACINALSNFELDVFNKNTNSGMTDKILSNQYGIGVMKWTNSRHDNYLKYVYENGGIGNLKTQLDFGLSELSSNQSLLNILKNESSPERAAAYIWTCFMGANNDPSSFASDEALYAAVSKLAEEAYASSSSNKDAWEKRKRYATEYMNWQ